MSRKGEFPNWVIKQKHLLSKCEDCEVGYDPKDPFVVHHRIFLDWGIKAGIPLAVLQSYENASLLHLSCHNHLHNEWWEPDPKVVREVLARCGVQSRFRT